MHNNCRHILIDIGVGSTSQLRDCIYKTMSEDYAGPVSVTNNGITCQAWVAQSPHSHKIYEDKDFPAFGSVSAAKNYCSNFGQEDPYCYTLNPFIKYGLCTLRICNGKSKGVNVVMFLLRIVVAKCNLVYDP